MSFVDVAEDRATTLPFTLHVPGDGAEEPGLIFLGRLIGFKTASRGSAGVGTESFTERRGCISERASWTRLKLKLIR